jgi:predicted O-methyltransferase YrrM
MADDGVFFAVDPYEPGRLGFSIPRLVGRAEVEGVRRGRVEWVRQTGARAAASEQIRRHAPFDFVFIDAAQTRDTLDQEWRAWSPLIAPDGIIAVHDSLRPDGDTSPEQTSVAYAREVVFTDRRFEVIETVDSLSVLKRRASL